MPALLAIALLGCGGSGYDSVPVGVPRYLEHASNEHCFAGTWREQSGGATQSFRFLLHISIDRHVVRGHFDWEAIEISSLPRLAGREARETLEGNVRDGRIELNGIAIDDPGLAALTQPTNHSVARLPFMGVDRYRIGITPSGLSGRSRTHEGDWSGVLEGQSVTCPCEAITE
jgi:hypothetical protein